MTDFIEQVREMLCDFCGTECCNDVFPLKPEACGREVTALEIVKLVEMIQDELDKMKKSAIIPNFFD